MSNTFTIKVKMTHTFIQDDEHTAMVVANTKEEATETAKKQAYRNRNLDSSEADHEDTSIDGFDIISAKGPDGKDLAEVPVRCTDTIDMFNKTA